MKSEPRKKSWWRGALAMLGWGAVLVVIYFMFSNGDGGVSIVWYFFVGILAFNYAVNTISEKLDTIIWTLEDIERKLPDNDPYI